MSARMGSNGDRMTSEQAVSILGKNFAGHVNGGLWVTGRVVSYCDMPQITIEDDAGVQHSYVVGTVRSWAASAGHAR